MTYACVIASGLCEAISTIEGIASSQEPLLAMTLGLKSNIVKMLRVISR